MCDGMGVRWERGLPALRLALGCFAWDHVDLARRSLAVVSTRGSCAAIALEKRFIPVGLGFGWDVFVAANSAVPRDAGI